MSKQKKRHFHRTKPTKRPENPIGGTTTSEKSGGETIMKTKTNDSENICIAPTQMMLCDITSGICFPEDGEQFPCEINLSVIPITAADDDAPAGHQAAVTLKCNMTRSAFRDKMELNNFRDAICDLDSIQETLLPVMMSDTPNEADNEPNGVILEVTVEARQYLPDDVLVTRAATASYIIDVPQNKMDAVFSRSGMCAIKDELEEAVRRRIEDVLRLA